MAAATATPPGARQDRCPPSLPARRTSIVGAPSSPPRRRHPPRPRHRPIPSTRSVDAFSLHVVSRAAAPSRPAGGSVFSPSTFDGRVPSPVVHRARKWSDESSDKKDIDGGNDFMGEFKKSPGAAALAEAYKEIEHRPIRTRSRQRPRFVSRCTTRAVPGAGVDFVHAAGAPSTPTETFVRLICGRRARSIGWHVPRRPPLMAPMNSMVLRNLSIMGSVSEFQAVLCEHDIFAASVVRLR